MSKFKELFFMDLRLSILFINILIITGCASAPPIKYNYNGGKVVDSYYPQKTVEATSFVGDSLLTYSHFKEIEALHLINSTGYFYPGFYEKIGDDSINIFYSSYSISEKKSLSSLPAARQNFTAVALSNTEPGKFCMIHLISGMRCMDAIIKKENIKSKEYDSFEQTLLYNGRVGDKITIGYREFSNDLARPAFSNTVEYDLTKSKEISYKGALIQVIDADNTKITYKIIKPFPKI